MKERSLVSGTPLSMYISSDPSLFGVGIFYYFSGRLYHCLPDILVSLSVMGISASPSSALESLAARPESSCETCSGQWDARRSDRHDFWAYGSSWWFSCVSLCFPLFHIVSESDLSKASTSPWHSCNMRKSYIFVVTSHQEFWDHIQHHLMHPTDTLSFYEWRKQAFRDI